MILTNLKIIGIIFLLEVSILYNDRLYLTPQEILEKEFKIDARGYRPQEVDKWLSVIIRNILIL